MQPEVLYLWLIILSGTNVTVGRSPILTLVRRHVYRVCGGTSRHTLECQIHVWPVRHTRALVPFGRLVRPFMCSLDATESMFGIFLRGINVGQLTLTSGVQIILLANNLVIICVFTP